MHTFLYQKLYNQEQYPGGYSLLDLAIQIAICCIPHFYTTVTFKGQVCVHLCMKVKLLSIESPTSCKWKQLLIPPLQLKMFSCP